MRTHTQGHQLPREGHAKAFSAYGFNGLVRADEGYKKWPNMHLAYGRRDGFETLRQRQERTNGNRRERCFCLWPIRCESVRELTDR